MGSGVTLRTRPRVLRYRLTATGRALVVAAASFATMAAVVVQPALAAAALALAAVPGVAFVATGLLVWRVERLATPVHPCTTTDALEVGQNTTTLVPLPLPLDVSLIDWHEALGLTTSGLVATLQPVQRLARFETARSGASLRCTLVAVSTGHHALHGVALRGADRLGLISIELYLPARVPVSVAPPTAVLPRHDPQRRSRDVRPTRDGTHPGARAGHAPTLRELRDYRPGDRQRDLDWQATARTGRWIVREREEDRQHALVVALDAGPTMLAGPGSHRFTACLALARAHLERALARGDRAGLILWDTATLADHPPDTGRRHRDALLRTLIDARAALLRPLDAHDDQDIARAVNQWLLEHAGIDFLAGVATGMSREPGGDERVHRLDTWCRTHAPDSDTGHGVGTAPGEGDALRPPGGLIAFADRWSIELPVASWDDARPRDAAASAALRSAAERLRDGDSLVVISDLAALSRPAALAPILLEAAQRRVVTSVRVPWSVPPAQTQRPPDPAFAAERGGTAALDPVAAATLAVLEHGEQERMRALAEHLGETAVSLRAFDPWALVAAAQGG